jgi:hypothetical protein
MFQTFTRAISSLKDVANNLISQFRLEAELVRTAF